MEDWKAETLERLHVGRLEGWKGGRMEGGSGRWALFPLREDFFPLECSDGHIKNDHVND